MSSNAPKPTSAKAKTTVTRTATRSADDTSTPTPSPSSSPIVQPGNTVAAEDIMQKMMEMMKQNEERFEKERKERERVVAEEKAMILQLLKESKERENQQRKETESIMQQLSEIKMSTDSSVKRQPTTPVATSSSSTSPLTLLSPEQEQKIRHLAFTIRSSDFDSKNIKTDQKPTVDIDDYVNKQKHDRFYDSTEEKVKRKEQKYEEKVIYENEDESENHLQSYVKWLEQREKLFPYETHQHQLYKRRYTLLSSWGRYCEWLRTGFYLGFPISLYGVNINRWYLFQLQTAGLSTNKSVRKVSDRVIEMPAMSYDDRDVRVYANSEEMEDILPNSNVLRSIPLPLRYTPDKHELETYNITSLQEYTKYMLKLKLQRVRLMRPDSDPSSSTSSSSENDLESYDCNICGCVVKDRPHSDVCAKCELLRKQVRSKVKLENNNVPSKTDIPKLEKLDENYNHTQEMYDKIKNLVREERESVGNTRPSQTSVSIAANITPAASNNESVLGRVLNELFTPSARRTLDLTRLAKPTSMTEITRSASQLVTDVGKFDGDVSTAPRWLHEYCRGVYRYSFDVPNCLYIITKCFIGEAKAWLDQILDKVSLLNDSTDTSTRPIEALLLQFKQQYMGQTQISMWKKQLAGTKLTSTAATVADLKSHYKTFVTIINNLRLCDKFISEEEYRTLYMDALPYSVSLYIGRDYQKFTTLDEIFQIAAEAIMKQNMREKTPADGGLAARKESINSLYFDTNTSEYNENIQYNALAVKRDVTDQQTQWRKINNAKMACFHCGRNGHTAYDCTLLSQPQTSLGAAAWAQRNVRLGATKPYDVTTYMKARDPTTSLNSPKAATPSISTNSPSSKPASNNEKNQNRRLYKQGKRVRPVSSKTAYVSSKDDSKDAEEVSD
jgi:hypothetical protein